MTSHGVIQPFDEDVGANSGYRYTTNAPLSSVLANRRLTDLALGLVEFAGKRVLDVGCGDGTYSIDLFDRGRPSAMHAVDPAREAIRVAWARKAGRPITFAVSTAEALPYPTGSFDLAHVRGVLHHMERPLEALREALRVATTVVVIEPNGYNPGLKLLERYSRYHIEHGERSFAPHALRRWATEVSAQLSGATFAGLVPFFCPDPVARLLKLLEPVVETAPGLRKVACAVYAFTLTRA